MLCLRLCECARSKQKAGGGGFGAQGPIRNERCGFCLSLQHVSLLPSSAFFFVAFSKQRPTQMPILDYFPRPAGSFGSCPSYRIGTLAHWQEGLLDRNRSCWEYALFEGLRRSATIRGRSKTTFLHVPPSPESIPSFQSCLASHRLWKKTR